LTILADPNAAGFYERNGAARGSTNSLFKFSVSGGISGRERDDAGADRRGALGRGAPAVCCRSMSSGSIPRGDRDLGPYLGGRSKC